MTASWSKRLACLVAAVTCSNTYTLAGGLDETISDGLILRQKLLDNKTLTYVRVSLDRFDVRVITPLAPFVDSKQALGNVSNNPERISRGFFLRDYLRRYNASAIISGGYIDSYSPPTSLGFVKSNSVTTSTPHASWLVDALFCSDVGRASVQLTTPTFDRPDFRDCLQAGPILLLNGTPPIDAPSVRGSGYAKFARLSVERTFACLDAAGRVLMGVTEKIDLPTVVGALRSPEIGCVNAIGLTGSDTSGLLVKTRVFGNDTYLFPNVLAVLPRSR